MLISFVLFIYRMYCASAVFQQTSRNINSITGYHAYRAPTSTFSFALLPLHSFFLFPLFTLSLLFFSFSLLPFFSCFSGLICLFLYQFVSKIHCLASRGKARKCFIWRNVDYNFDYTGVNGTRRNSKSNDTPISLLNAIGVSVFRSYETWLENTSKDTSKDKVKVDEIEVKKVTQLLHLSSSISSKIIPVKTTSQNSTSNNSPTRTTDKNISNKSRISEMNTSNKTNESQQKNTTKSLTRTSESPQRDRDDISTKTNINTVANIPASKIHDPACFCGCRRGK